MSRWYGEPVVVRPAEAGISHGPAFRPSAFLWRGKVYVVRDVLGHWLERRAWWAGSAAQALHGDGDPAPDRDRPTNPSGVALDIEREIWRVEASRGRVFGSGVFDLCRDSASSDEWRLLHVSD